MLYQVLIEKTLRTKKYPISETFIPPNNTIFLNRKFSHQHKYPQWKKNIFLQSNNRIFENIPVFMKKRVKVS